MKRFLGWCALAVVIGLGARAGAQAPDERAGPPTGAPTVGDPGHWALSFDRLFGFDYSRVTESMGGVDQPSVSVASFSLFSNRESATLSAFSFPRAAADLFLAPGFSLGTSLGVFTGARR